MRKYGSVLLVLALMVLFFAPVVHAQESKVVMELSLDKAIDRALGYSRTLEKAELDLDEADDVRVWIPEIDYVDYSAGVEERMFAAESTYFAHDRAQKSYELQRGSVILDVTQKYYNVLNAIEKLKAVELSLAQAEAEVRIARAMLTVGLTNRLAVDGAEMKLNMARAELVGAQAGVDNAYVALNQQVRFNIDERPVLVDAVVFKPISLAQGVYESRALSDNPSLDMVRAAVDYMKSVENYSVGGKIQVTSTDVKKADLDVGLARDGVQKLIRHLYGGVKTLEENYAVTERGLAIAEENYRITQLKYELGMTTRTQVLKAEAESAAAKERLLGLVVQHAYLKLALEKPWAYVGISGSM